MPDSPDTPRPQQMLADRYVLGNIISRGGMAEVWQARDDVLARTVAVKILRADLAGDESFVERFKREALAAARLTHPHIVAIYDTGSDVEGDPDGAEPRHYIVMEHCDGGTFRAIVDGAPVEAERVIGLLSPVCDALDYAHTNGIVHRDLKPENVLVSHQGALKVADFGIAKAAFARGDITTTGTIIGTVTYISPEQASGVEPDLRTDIYSLGVMVYEALVGRPPFKEETDVATALAHLNQEPPPLRSIKAGIPRALDTAVLKALAKDPEDRYASAGEMQTALEATLDSGSTQVLRVRQRSSSHSEPADQRSSARKGLWLGLAALLAGIAILFFVLSQDGENELLNERGQEEQEEPGGGAAAGEISVDAVQDFDPHADGAEHPDEVALASDGDPATSWSSETYQAALNLVKPGVGLVFDLGSSKEVSEVVVDLDSAGYALELRAADEIGADESAFDDVGTVGASGSSERFRFEPVTARYWLVWITGLPGGSGGSASIAEVKFIGP